MRALRGEERLSFSILAGVVKRSGPNGLLSTSPGGGYMSTNWLADRPAGMAPTQVASINNALAAPNLFDALMKELAVFRIHNEANQLPFGNTATASPGVESIPHWNAVYPLPTAPNSVESAITYTPEQLSQMKSTYASFGTKPHLILFDSRWGALSAETSEYFVVTRSQATASTIEGSIQIETHNPITPDLLDTSIQIMREAFDLDDPFTRYFREKLLRLVGALPNTMWLAKNTQGNPVGCLHAFQTSEGVNFLFNMAVMPTAQKQGIATSLLQQAIGSAQQVYIYSDNPVMCEKILPKVGFTSLGKIYVVPVESYEGASETH